MNGVTIRGEKELIKKLVSLENKTRRKFLRKANGKAIRPVVQSAKANVRRESSTVSKSIGVRHKSYKRGATQASIVGPRNVDSVVKERPHVNPFTGKVGVRKHDPRHTAHLIEGGTKPHTIKIFKNLTVRHPGTSPRPFLEPAMKKNENKVVTLHAQVLRELILMEVR